MVRVNLKDLKSALNKLPDDKLEHFFITHGMAVEDPEPNLKLMFFVDESEHDDYEKVYDIVESKVLIDFVEAVWDDAKKCMICVIDEGKIDDYMDDFPE